VSAWTPRDTGSDTGRGLLAETAGDVLAVSPPLKGGLGIADNTITVVAFDTTAPAGFTRYGFDHASMFNTTTHQVTIPFDGIYQINSLLMVNAQASANALQTITVWIGLNGATSVLQCNSSFYQAMPGGFNYQATPATSDLQQFFQGDTVDIRFRGVSSLNTLTWGLSGGPGGTYFDMHLISRA
jgi:hypothetical protein